MPVLALCQALRSLNSSVEISFIGTGNETEQVMVESHSLPYYSIPSGKFRRYGRGVVTELTDLKTLQANIKDARKFFTGRSRARALLRELKPDVVFTKGSNPSVPVGLAAARLGIPLVIHESDAIMGLANRILSRKASAVATGFPIKNFTGIPPKTPLVYTGSPIRNALLTGTASRANDMFALDAHRPVMLVIGGSNGALPINRVLWEALHDLTRHVQVIHLVGTLSFPEAAQHTTKGYYPIERLGDELADVYARATLVLSRAGATTLAELAHFGKPTILIPWPGAANNHQVANAAFFSHAGAARVIEQDHLTRGSLLKAVTTLLDHPADRQHLSAAISRLAKSDAALELAQLVLKNGGHHG